MTLYTVDAVPSFEIESVATDQSLLSALETMFEEEYTQLGVKREDELVGMVSYRSIARVLKVMRKMGIEKDLPGRRVTMAIEDLEPTVTPNDDITVLFDLLDKSSYVLIEPEEGGSYEILTNYDLLHFIQESSEPFLLVEEIERTVRDLMKSVFPERLSDELNEAFENMDDFPTPDTVTDCSFGHYPIFLSKNWNEFEGYFEEDRDFVTNLLDQIGDIRNQLFHFRTEHNGDIDYELLRFAHSYFFTLSN